LQGHIGEVWATAFSPHSPVLVTGGQDGTIKLWDVATGKCLKTLRNKRPYEQMNITKVSGLTEAQKESLKVLGAVELE
jgi:WD40 repeat protein